MPNQISVTNHDSIYHKAGSNGKLGFGFQRHRLILDFNLNFHFGSGFYFG
jgi:hypothetical protein